MKTYTFQSRPTTVQELLRRFAAGNPPGRAEGLRYLAEPCYKEIIGSNGKEWTVAGDGWVFLWVQARVPGFRQYVVPPAGGVYEDVPGWIARVREGAVASEVPGDDGVGDAAGVQEVRLLPQGRALVRKVDLERLRCLDWCRVGGGREWWGEAWRNGAAQWLVFEGHFERYKVRGVVKCVAPEVAVSGRKAPVLPGKTGRNRGQKRSKQGVKAAKSGVRKGAAAGV